MNIITNEKMQKIYLILTVGTPGVIRLLVLFTLAKFTTLELVGVLVYKWAIVLMISMITVDGFSALLSSRLPPKKSNAARIRIISKQLSNGLSLMPLAIIIWFVFDSKFSVGDIVFCLCWFFYGMTRYLLITLRKYRTVLIIELLSLLLMLMIIILGRAYISDVTIGYLFMPLGFLSIAVLILYYGFKVIFKIRPSFEFIGIKFGITNLLSGGVGQAVIPVVKVIYGEILTGYIGIILSILNFLLLVPRAMAQYYLPRLSMAAKPRKYQLYNDYRKKIHMVLSISLFAMPILWLLITEFYINFGNGNQYLLMFIMIYLSLLGGQLSLPSANYFMVQELPKYLLFSNYIHVIFVVLLAFPVIYFVPVDGVIGVSFVYFIVMLSNVLRYIYMGITVRKLERVV